jgi:hypothetical protein
VNALDRAERVEKILKSKGCPYCADPEYSGLLPAVNGIHPDIHQAAGHKGVLCQTRIDLWSVQEQKDLLTMGLQSEEARNFLERRPSLDRLMPTLQLADVEKELDKEQQAKSDYEELPWRRRY